MKRKAKQLEELSKSKVFDFWKNKGEGGRSSYSNIDTCPRCNTELRFRGNEKETQKFRYYRHEEFCPTCGKIYSFEEGKSRRHKHFGRMLGRYIGEIGERFTRKFLVENGYAIRSFLYLVSDVLYPEDSLGLSMIRKSEAKMFLGDRFEDFVKYCQAWNKDAEIPTRIRPISRNYIRRMKERIWSPHLAGFDWVGKKEGKIYFIEVKTNSAVLSNDQKKRLLRAKDYGFIPLVFRLRVDVNIPEEAVRIEEL